MNQQHPTQAAVPLEPEILLRTARSLLATAHQLEVAGEIDDAEAVGAIAGNKLAAAIRLAERA